jgi:hypothetical protein
LLDALQGNDCMPTERAIVLPCDEVGVAAAVRALADQPVDTIEHSALASAAYVAECRVFEKALNYWVLPQSPRIVQVAEKMFGRRRKGGVRIHAGRATSLTRSIHFGGGR